MTFSGQEWVFQQDSAPAQKTKTTQEWLRRKFVAFISAENGVFWGVQISKPWTINCGLFWRIWRAESVRTVWRA